MIKKITAHFPHQVLIIKYNYLNKIHFVLYFPWRVPYLILEIKCNYSVQQRHFKTLTYILIILENLNLEWNLF